MTVVTGKGRDATSGIDNDGLTLGRTATPQINVMGSVALIQGTDLLGNVAAADTTGSILILI
jgi:hypothetical protein